MALSLGSIASSALSGVSVQSTLSGLGGLGSTINNLISGDVYTNVPTKDLTLTQATKVNIFKKDNTISGFNGYIGLKRYNHSNSVIFEDPSKFGLSFLREMNTYQFTYQKGIKAFYNSSLEGKKVQVAYLSTNSSMALFNPYYGVAAAGIAPNVPLINGLYTTENNFTYIKDCTIQNLIKDSLTMNSPLGQARYRLIDFMYCKDLGKVPNNHLITLRRFPFAIGDHIGRLTNPNMSDPSAQDANFSTPGDIGRLVTWFGTEDNKLEDICKYEMKMSWKEYNSEIQEVDNGNQDQDKAERGLFGTLANTMNPAYNSFNVKYGGANNTFFNYLGSKIFKTNLDSSSNYDIFRMDSDKNKVYTPKNTVQDTHIYEGKLTLNQEITINFCYKLRAYDNINPKSAMLDLMGNILETTYNRGRYWAGARRMIGPPTNTSAWQTYDAFLENAWQKLGGVIHAMASGTINFNDILGSIANFMKGALDKGTKMVGNVVESVQDKGVLGAVASGAEELEKLTGASNAVKAMLKSKLGRPKLFALNSLIGGHDVGFWHLTVGNPYNPIMSIGNLIMTNSSVQHMGPLGVDDFPSEVKVTVTLKPGRSRDVIEIGRYYTQGIRGIYQAKVRQPIEQFHQMNLAIGENAKNNVYVAPENEVEEDRLVSSKNQPNKSSQQAQPNTNNNPNKGAKDAQPDTAMELANRQVMEKYQGYKNASNDGLITDPTNAMLFTHNQYNPLFLMRGYDEVASG